MNSATRLKAKFVVYTMVGKEESENVILGALLRVVHRAKAWWWIQKVNHMSEGEILRLYYLLTNGATDDDR